jgi:hypothetical protein
MGSPDTPAQLLAALKARGFASPDDEALRQVAGDGVITRADLPRRLKKFARHLVASR